MRERGRRRVQLNTLVTEEARQAIYAFAKAHGVPATAFLEQLGRMLADTPTRISLRHWIDGARRIDRERHRR